MKLVDVDMTMVGFAVFNMLVIDGIKVDTGCLSPYTAMMVETTKYYYGSKEDDHTHRENRS